MVLTLISREIIIFAQSNDIWIHANLKRNLNNLQFVQGRGGRFLRILVDIKSTLFENLRAF